jgi:hypothetical protein
VSWRPFTGGPSTVKEVDRITPHYRAYVETRPDLLESFAVGGKAPRSVVVLAVEAVYFQCARAIVRSALWNPDSRVSPDSLPSAGVILAALSDGRVGGDSYDAAWPERTRRSLW